MEQNEIVIKYKYELIDFVLFQQYLQRRTISRVNSKLALLLMFPFLVLLINTIVIKIDYLLLMNICGFISFFLYNFVQTNRIKDVKYQIKLINKVYPFNKFDNEYILKIKDNDIEIYSNNEIIRTVAKLEITEIVDNKDGLYLFSEEITAIIIPKTNIRKDQIDQIQKALRK